MKVEMAKRTYLRGSAWCLPLLAALLLIDRGWGADRARPVQAGAKPLNKSAMAEGIAAMARAARDAAAELKAGAARNAEAVGKALAGSPHVEEQKVGAEALRVLTTSLAGVPRREIYFIHKTCELTPDQWRAMSKQGEHRLREIADDVAQGRNRHNRGMVHRTVVVNGNAVQVRLPVGSIQRIRDGVAEAARRTFTAEQVARLDKAIADRRDFRRRAVVLMCISSMDRELALSTDQREELAAKLTAEWQPSWGMEPEWATYNQAMLPPIPARLLEGILTKSQLGVLDDVAGDAKQDDKRQAADQKP